MKIAVYILLSLLPSGLAFSANPAATIAFDELKALKGEWRIQGSKDGSKVTYEVRSDGNSLVETLWDMVTVYHLDGDSILMTHYCSAGNQPRTRATVFQRPLKQLEFKFVDGTNLEEGGHHIIGLTIELLSADRIKHTWISSGQNSVPTIIELERSK